MSWEVIKVINDGTVVILQERMAGFLMFTRNHKIGEKKDLKNPSRNIYIFKDTPQLQESLARYDEYKELVKN